MSRYFQEEIEQIKNELANDYEIIQRNDQLLERDPWLEQQILLWLENTRFLIAE